MKWLVVKEDYLTYLRENGDSHIPLSNYGNDKYKPFFGSLFISNDCYYVTQISHPQKKHRRLKDSMDFKKLFIPDSDRLLAVINLNYMFPIPKDMYFELQYKNIEKYKDFTDDNDKSKYIDLLRRELDIVNNMDIGHAARLVYQNKYDNPGSKLAQRCIDFKELEKLALSYKKGM